MTLRKIINAPLLDWYRWRLKVNKRARRGYHLLAMFSKPDDRQGFLMAAELFSEIVEKIETKIARLS